VFGVELNELEYNHITRRFRLTQKDEVYKVKEAGEIRLTRTHKILKPVLIGNKEDNDEGFIILEYCFCDIIMQTMRPFQNHFRWDTAEN
jgi:hypothetical protein